MKYLIVFYFIIFFQPVISQNRNYIWCFGDSAGIDFTNTVNAVPTNSFVNSRGSCVSISDSIAHIVLYAFNRAGNWDHSTQIYNSSNQIIQDGDSVIGEGNYNELLLLPDPGDVNKYYL